MLQFGSLSLISLITEKNVVTYFSGIADQNMSFASLKAIKPLKEKITSNYLRLANGTLYQCSDLDQQVKMAEGRE